MAKKEEMGNVPNLRFKGFEGEWEMKKLNDLCEINPKNESLPSSFIYIDLESVSNGRLLKEESISKDEAPSRAQRLLAKNDVLFQMVRPYQKNNLFFDKIGEYVASTGYAQIRTNQNSRFIFHSLHSQKFVDKVIERCTGTSYPAINSTDLGNIKISYPNLDEQEKVADFLSLLNSRIDCSIKIISHYQSLIKNLRNDIFMQKARFKNEYGNLFHNWQNKKLKDVAKVFDGTHQTPTYVEKGISFYSVENVTGNNFKNTKFISENVFQKENKRVKIEKGDILMTRIGDIGTIRFIDWDVCASFYVSLALIKKHQEYNSEYLAHYLATKEFQKELWDRTIHVAFPKKINLGEIGECMISLPSLEEQNKIAYCLSSIAAKIETEKSILEQLKKQKQYLLSNLFI